MSASEQHRAETAVAVNDLQERLLGGSAEHMHEGDLVREAQSVVGTALQVRGGRRRDRL